jgi:hypothetical protein
MSHIRNRGFELYGKYDDAFLTQRYICDMGETRGQRYADLNRTYHATDESLGAPSLPPDYAPHQPTCDARIVPHRSSEPSVDR